MTEYGGGSSPIDYVALDHNFEHHAPDADAITRHEHVRDAARTIAVGLRGVGAQEQYKAARARWAAHKWERTAG